MKKTLQQLDAAFNRPCVPIQIPIGEGEDFKGIVDIYKRKAYFFDEKGNIGKIEDVPEELNDKCEEYRDKIMDFAAEADEDLMMKYLDGEKLTDEEFVQGLHKSVSDGSLAPVVCASAEKLIGISTLLDSINFYLPSPSEREDIEVEKMVGGTEEIALKEDSPLTAFVFKTTVDDFAGRLSFARIFSGTLQSDKPFFNVSLNGVDKAHQLLEINGKEHKTVTRATAGDIIAIPKHDKISTGHTLCEEGRAFKLAPPEFPPATIQMALRTVSKGDDEKLGICLPKIVEEDPTLSTKREPDTHELILSGMGELHLNIVMQRLKDHFNIEVETSVPKVAYKETIMAKGSGRYRHKKQSGGRGQFGEVHLRIEPTQRGSGYEFENGIVGGVIPLKIC